MNCSDNISREHYVSNSILSQLPQPFRIEGLPWQNEEGPHVLKANALTAKILCQRHNSALAPLDTAAGHAFSVFKEAKRHARNAQKRDDRFFLIDGHALELWGFKTLAGLYFGKIAASAEKEKLIEQHEINIHRLVKMLSGDEVFPFEGMYFVRAPEEQDMGTMLFTTVSSEESVVKSLKCVLPPVQLLFVFDIPQKNMTDFIKKPYRRPPNIIISGKYNTAHVVFAWDKPPVNGFQCPELQIQN